jgi:hypothetical protein
LARGAILQLASGGRRMTGVRGAVSGEARKSYNVTLATLAFDLIVLDLEGASEAEAATAAERRLLKRYEEIAAAQRNLLSRP